MEDLRIATPPRAARARKRHELPKEKKKSAFAKVVDHVRQTLFGENDKIKEEAKLTGLGDEDDDETSQAGSTIAEANEPVAPRPSIWLRLKNTGRKYLAGKQGDDEEEWDGNGVPPWVERGSSVAWSEDKSRQASEYGDNVFDYIANPRRILKEPPVFFDPVEDRIRSRWLPVFALCCFPAILATVLLLNVWDKSPVFKLDERPVLNTLFRSGDPMLLNVLPATNMTLKVQALNRNGWPLKNLEIKTHVTDWELAPTSVRNLPRCTRAFGGGDEENTLPVCAYILSGSSAVTDRDGVAEFSALHFAGGVPGAYRLEFYADRALLNVTEWFSVKPVVSKLIVAESYTADRSGGTDLVFSDTSKGLPLSLTSPPPAVRIVLAGGVDGLKSETTLGSGPLQLSNLTVHAVHLNAAWDLGGTLSSHIHLSSNPEVSVIPNSHVVLAGNSAQVDANGVATFSNLAVAGYDRPHLLLAFVCQGQVLVWSQVGPPSGYNASEYAAARGGSGAFASIAYTTLPAATGTLTALAAAALPADAVSRSGAFSVTEGAAFGLNVEHDAKLAGGAFVGKLRPLVSSGVDFSAAAYRVEEGGVVLQPPTHHKQFLGNPTPFIALGSSGIGKGLFRSSLIGAPGLYLFELYFMGERTHSFRLTIDSAVEMLTPGDMSDSPVLCGSRLTPVCRHANGACSFGKVSGSTELPIPSGVLCDGMHVLTEYSTSGSGNLPWAQLEGRATANEKLFDTSGKLVSLEFVPWGADVRGFEVPVAPTPAPTANTSKSRAMSRMGTGEVVSRRAPPTEYSTENLHEWDVVASSRMEQLTGRYASGKIAAVRLLVVPSYVKHVMPVFRVDDLLFPMMIKVPVTSFVSKAATTCGLRACTWIKVEVGLPADVIAGSVVSPAPSAKLMDGEGLPVAGAMVCLIHGTAEEVEAQTRSASAQSAYWETSYRNFLCESQKGAAPSSLQCSQLPATLAAMHCASTNSTGQAELMSVTLQSNAMLGDVLTVWRFLAVNAFPDRQIACLSTYSSWMSTCRSPLMSVNVINRIQSISSVPRAGQFVGTISGQRSLQVSAHASAQGNVAGTTIIIALKCRGNATVGVVACVDVQASLKRVWNSRSHVPVSLSAQTFSAQADGSGLLTVTLLTRLAGIYMLELTSHGASDQLFVRLRHDAKVLTQLWDRRAVRVSEGVANYTYCQYDCGARNVSNIGREHPQEIRALVADADNVPLHGAQVWVEMAGSTPGQLSGCISDEQTVIEDWLPSSTTTKVSGTVSTLMPRLAVSAAYPGTYRLKMRVLNPSPLPNTVQDLSPVELAEFYVKDRVFLTVDAHPPIRTAGGVTRGDGMEQPVKGELDVVSFRIEILRWKGHTSFMYADKWVPPVVDVQVAGVAVAHVPGGAHGVGDQEHVKVSLQGLRVGSYRVDQRQLSRATALPTESSLVSIKGRTSPLSFGRYCMAVGGDGILRSNESRDDTNTLFLPEGTAGSINVDAVNVSTIDLPADGIPEPILCSRAFAVSDKVYSLVVMNDYPRRIGQGEEVYIKVRATAGTGEPIEGIAIESEVADVSCSRLVVRPVTDASSQNTSEFSAPTQTDLCAGSDTPLDFKGPGGNVDVLKRTTVTLNTQWTTRIKMLTETGHALLGSVGVTDVDGIATVPFLLLRARAGRYQVRFRSGATVTHPTDVIEVTSIVNGIRIVEPMVGLSERTWVRANPLGPNDFTVASQGDLMLLDGVHKITGDISSDQTIRKPDVQVVDAYGNSVKRSKEISLHIVSCGRRFVPNGTISFPPTADSDCEEFMDWDMDATPAWVCRNKAKCDEGFTRIPPIRFWYTTLSGFYFVFFASDGFVTEQEQLLYVQNMILPADSSVLSYRLFILIGLCGIPLVFNANQVNRGRIWLQFSLAGLAFFVLAGILYIDATIRSYGSPSKVQRELVLCGVIMVFLTSSVAIILMRLVFQPDSMQYFTARQNKYLNAMRNLFLTLSESRPQTRAKTAASSNRVYPEAVSEYKTQNEAEKASPQLSARSEGSQKALLGGKNFGGPGMRGSYTRERAMLAGKDFGFFSAKADGAKVEGNESGETKEDKTTDDTGGKTDGGEDSDRQPAQKGRRGKPAKASGGSEKSGEMRRRAAAPGNRVTARMKVSSSSKSTSGKWGNKWRPSLPSFSLRSILLLRTKEGRKELEEYWDKVFTDFINTVTGAKVQSKGGQVQEGFQYPMRLLAGMMLSLVGILIMLIGFESAQRRTNFGLERLRAEVVRYRLSLAKFDTSVDLSQEKAALPTPPYSDTYDIVALTYTVMESLYGGGPELFENLLYALDIGNSLASLCVIASWLWTNIQLLRVYRQKMLALRADRSLVNHWKYPIHEAAGYPGRQMWASMASGLLVWLPTAFVVALFLFTPSSRFLVVWILLPIGGLLAIELASWFIRRVFNKLACDGPYIKNRVIFGTYDFIGLYAHFITGTALAVSRMVLTYIDFAVNFGRLDLPVVEGKVQHWDSGHSSFMAMLYLDFFYNAPITSTLAYNLASAMYHRRELKEVADQDMTRKGHHAKERARVASVQRNRWHFLFTIDRNRETLPKFRVHPPPPPNTWDVDDDVLEVESVQASEDEDQIVGSEDEI